MPRVAVLTALYNHEAFVGRAIESVLAQTYRDWELILWDDGSSDRSLAIAQEYAENHGDRLRVFTHSNGANRGQEETRNAALRETAAEYFCLLDSDDFYHPSKLENLVPLLDAKDVGLAYGETIHVESATGKEFPSQARRSGSRGF